MQLELPVNEYVPAMQVMHEDKEVLPVNGLYVPAGQAVQEDEELSMPYVPVGQTEQTACPANAYVPIGHMLHDVFLLPGMLL